MAKSKTPKKKIDSGVLIGIIAIIINLITVSVYIYQANIMQTQQYVSAWPYLEWTMRYNNTEGLEIVVSNNGIGPAIIKGERISLNGQVMSKWDSVIVEIAGTRLLPFSRSYANNRVVPAGASLSVLKVNDPRWSEIIYFDSTFQQTFEYQLCYESVYGESWVTKGLEVIEAECP